jgi:hypothetical protein
MAKYLIDGKTLTSIADAIREKTGVTGKIDGKDMAAEIRSISASGPLTLGEDKIARFSGSLNEISYVLWKLENDGATNISGTNAFAWGPEYDFSSDISTPGSYFVTCTEFGYDPDIGERPVLGHYVSNVVTFSEDAENWLFEDVEFVVDSDSGDLLAYPKTAITRELEDGKSYTLFRGSEEFATETAFYHPDIGATITFNFLGIEAMRFGNKGWHCTVSGKFSVRIND